MAADVATGTGGRTSEEVVRVGTSLFERGLTAGSSGNLSTRTNDEVLITPTNASLGRLTPDALSVLAMDGKHLSGAAPSKEWPVHLAFYRARPDYTAVVHLHSTYAVAVSCLHEDAQRIPPLTPYFVMRIGALGVVPYYPPGHPSLARAISELAGHHHAILLANHGPVVAGTSLTAASDAIEELEETAKLHLLLQNHDTRPLTESQVDDLVRR